MAIRRMVLKRTSYLDKGTGAANAGREVRRYLARYVDEQGKAAQKRGESPWRTTKGQEEEIRWLLPEDSTGILYSGGFLRESKSPGLAQKEKQRAWIRRVTHQWVQELRTKNRRKSDGTKIVISMAPKAVEDLTQQGVSVDAALREIWEKTTELYRARHGWDNPKGELAWISGAHHDTNNAHLHIFLFPTTRSGDPLRTTFKGVGKNREDYRMEMIAMTNIAAEMFWREHLGLEYQSPDYIKAVSENPAVEPRLPALNEFGKGKAIVEEKGTKRSKPKLNMALVARSAIDDTLVATGGGPIQRRQGKGIRRLKAIIASNLAYGEDRKLKLWEIIRNLKRKPQEASEALESDFPEETKALEALEAKLEESKRKQEKSLAKRWRARGSEWAAALLETVLGLPEEPDNEQTGKEGAKLAEASDNTTRALPTEKLKAAWKQGTDSAIAAASARIRSARYRAAKRSAGAEDKRSAGAELLKRLIRGSERLTHILEGRKEEVQSAVRKTKTGFEKRVETREWTAGNGKMERKESTGAPWPDHYEPATVFEPLKAGTYKEGKQKRLLTELSDSLEEKAPEESEKESIIQRLVRTVRPRRLARERMAREEAKREEPEIR